MINKHRQKGAETVEFAMVALVFFALLFAVLEFGRALFVWNALTEATRRGARMAAICPYSSAVPAKVAIFDAVSGSLGSSSIVAGLKPSMVNVRYLNQAGSVEANQSLVRFVEVGITGYSYQFIVPLWGSTVTMPPFTTTLAAESLGAVPTYPGETVKTPACNY